MSIGIRNLVKGFNGNTILKSVSFSQNEGQVVSIIGPSGSGKTTLLRCLNFLETADSGTLTLAGKTITLLPEIVKTLLSYVARLLWFSSLITFLRI